MDEAEVSFIVVECLHEIVSEKCEEEGIEMPQLDEGSYLIGRRAVLDSLGLVTLIVSIEQKLDDDFGASLTIADDRALSMENSPFRTVRSLTDYILLLIEEQTENAPT